MRVVSTDTRVMSRRVSGQGLVTSELCLQGIVNQWEEIRMKPDDLRKTASFDAATGAQRRQQPSQSRATLQRLVDLLWEAKSDADVVAAVEDLLRGESDAIGHGECDVCAAEQVALSIDGTDRGVWQVECTGVCGSDRRTADRPVRPVPGSVKYPRGKFRIAC